MKGAGRSDRGEGNARAEAETGVMQPVSLRILAASMILPSGENTEWDRGCKGDRSATKAVFRASRGGAGKGLKRWA